MLTTVNQMCRNCDFEPPLQKRQWVLRSCQLRHEDCQVPACCSRPVNVTGCYLSHAGLFGFNCWTFAGSTGKGIISNAMDLIVCEIRVGGGGMPMISYSGNLASELPHFLRPGHQLAAKSSPKSPNFRSLFIAQKVGQNQLLSDTTNIYSIS